MICNKENVRVELNKLLSAIFALEEIDCVKIRDIEIRNDARREEKVEEALEESYHDCYSDVDLAVVVKLSPKETITQAQYMKRIDRFGFGRENCLGILFVEENSMYRIVQKNGIRYDFGFHFVCDDSAKKISMEPERQYYDNPKWPVENIDRFWFIQVQALGKLYRNDFLIGDHLANMGLNETLVQQMVLRDIQHNTNHHRYGYSEKPVYLKTGNGCPYKTDNEVFNLIADKLYCAALAYDELAVPFYPEYEKRSPVYFEIWESYEQGKK